MRPGPEDGPAGAAAPLAAVILAALLLRLLFFSGLTGYDEFAYASIAGDIAAGTFDFRAVSGYYGFRYLVVFPAALFHKILGPGAAAAAAWPLLCSLGNTVLAYCLGREFFGRRAGLLAAVFQAFLPVSVIYGTMLYPEEILVFLTGLSALLFLKGSAREGRWGGLWHFAAAGFLAGLGWHARLNSAVILVIYAVWAVWRGARPAHLAVAAGFAGALLPDWLAGAVLAGDPLFSLRSQLAKLTADAAVYPGGHLVYLRGLLGLDLYGLALFGPYFYLFAAAMAVAVWKGEFRRVWLPFAWFAIVLLYLEFGPASLSPYQPVHKQLRFLSMAFFPVLAVAADLAARSGPFLARSALVVLLAGSAAASWKMSAYRRAEAAPLKAAGAYLAARGPARVFADGEWANAARYYLRSLYGEPYYGAPDGGSVRPLAEAAAPGRASGGCLVAGPGRRNPAAGVGSALELPGGAAVYCFK